MSEENVVVESEAVEPVAEVVAPDAVEAVVEAVEESIIEEQSAPEAPVE